MEGQGQTPQQAPDVVPVAEVGLLVDQHMAADGLVPRRLRGQIDGGAEQTKEAGRGQAYGPVHRQPAPGVIHGPSDPPQPPGKGQIREEERGQRDANTGRPDQTRELGQVGLGRGDLGLRPASLLPLDFAGRLCGQRQDRPALPFLPHCVAGRFLLVGCGGPLPVDLRERGGGHGDELRRDQQPDQRQQPQGVPQPGADPPPQRRPQDQDHGDDPAGGQCPGYRHRSPSSASRRISRSSRRSSSVSSCRRAMVLIISPTLPRYTRSRKLLVS